MNLTKGQIGKLKKFWAPFGMTYCNACGKTKDFNCFTKRTNGQYNTRCKGCDKAYRAVNADRIKEAQAQYRSHNRAKARSYSKDYHASRRQGNRDPDKPWPAGWCSYQAAHKRAESVYGKARNSPCTECGQQAEQWAYNHQDPNEFSGPVTDFTTQKTHILRWSGHHDYYVAMCASCHSKFDLAKKK